MILNYHHFNMFTKKDLDVIDFAIDKLSSKESKKLVKELTTLKNKVSKTIKVQEIKDTKW